MATSVAAVAYVWESLTSLVPELDAYSWISPFHHYVAADPLIRGFDFAYLIGCLVAILARVIVALITFSRRDVRS
ncbi:MAG: hypothetical protein ACR2LG_04980 [Actinomycetota bacterium]